MRRTVRQWIVVTGRVEDACSVTWFFCHAIDWLTASKRVRIKCSADALCTQAERSRFFAVRPCQ